MFSSGEGIPEQWPSDVARPDDLDEVFGTYIAEGGDENIVVTGTTGATAQDAFDDYVSRLDADGFSEESKLNQGTEFYSGTYTRGDTTVSVTTQSDGDSTSVVIAVN